MGWIFEMFWEEERPRGDCVAKKKNTPIHLSRHAIKRWRERVGDDETQAIQTKIRKGIKSALRKGKNVNRRGAIVVNVVPGVRAVVTPDIRGGWLVVTVLTKETGEREQDAM